MISDSYLSQQKELHKNPNYGAASITYAPLVLQVMDKAKATSVSDYGAGKCNLKRTLNELGRSNFEYYPYDPAFPEYGAARPADLVACIDVLEHVEMDYLDAVLDDLARITVRVGLYTIHTGPAIKVLSDGRNAHLIQQPSSWWLSRLCERFEVLQLEQDRCGFWLVAKPRKVHSARQAVKPGPI